MGDRRDYYKQWRADNPKRVKELNKTKNDVHRERYATDPCVRGTLEKNSSSGSL